MKKILVLIVFIFSYCSTSQLDKRNGAFNLADYFEKISNIKLPTDIELIHEYDTGEGQAEALYSATSQDIKSLLTKSKFLPIDSLIHLSLQGNANYKIQYLDRISLQFNQDKKYNLLNYPDLVYFTICKQKNSHLLLVDEKSKLIWLKISYPDWSGDGPSCD